MPPRQPVPKATKALKKPVPKKGKDSQPPADTAAPGSEKDASGSLSQNVAVSKRTARQAKMQADELGISLKDYVEHAVGYFNKYKLSPVTENEVEDIPKEVHRLRNHLFGFLKEQERQYILPLVKQVYTIHDTTEHLSGMVERLTEQMEAVYLLLYKIKTIQDLNLSTLYKAMDDSGTQPVGEIIEENTRIFKGEMAQFEAKLEEKRRS